MGSTIARGWLRKRADHLPYEGNAAYGAKTSAVIAARSAVIVNGDEFRC